MIPYSKVKEHDSDNITLLCPNHHRDKTSGRISLESIISFNKNPFNKLRMFSKNYTIERSAKITISLGRNTIFDPVFDCDGNFPVIYINGLYGVAVHNYEGWLSISIVLTDLAGRVALVVDRGEMASTTRAWDYRYEGTRLRVFADEKNTILDVDLSNDRFDLHKGAIIDPRDRSGFVVEDGALITFAKGQDRGISIGCTVGRCGGGWGVANSAVCGPNQWRPAFGFFTQA